jgi:haloacetate dehalogenase
VLFKSFDLRTMDMGRSQLRVRAGGRGPAVLLLHGHPQTHMMWHRVAEALAPRHSLVIPDLPGYGDSTLVPAEVGVISPAAKRSMATQLVRLMHDLGHERFAVVGHDRGGRVAYRMALDHPAVVTRLAVLDIVPTAEMWDYADQHGRDFGMTMPHWLFLAQPFDAPERLISAAPEQYYFTRADDHFEPEALADYRRCVADPATVHAICEDYRAGAGIDDELDRRDRGAHRRIGCPVLVLWSARGQLPRWFHVLNVWRRWADDVRGDGIDAGHFLAEDAPEPVSAALATFLGERS